MQEKYEIAYDDFVVFKTQRQDKINKFESRKDGGPKPFRKQKRYDTIVRGDRDDSSQSQYLIPTPYENKNYNVRNEINILRQEVYELRKLVMAR